MLSVQDCDWVLAKVKEFPAFFSWLIDEGALYVIKALLDSGRLSIDLNSPNDSNKDAAAGVASDASNFDVCDALALSIMRI